jgi:hypothetical protein
MGIALAVFSCILKLGGFGARNRGFKSALTVSISPCTTSVIRPVTPTQPIAAVHSGAFLAYFWCNFEITIKIAPINSISHEEIDMEALKQGADALFILLGGIMVLAMHAGFAFLELGTVRRKNQVNALVKILVDFSVSTVAYFMVGYAVAYGTGFAFWRAGLDQGLDR